MLSAGVRIPYDVGHDPQLAESLMTPTEAAAATAIAAELRSAIYAGRYAPGSQLPSRVKIAGEKGVSAETVGVAVRMLEGEGLVEPRHGSGTYVLARRRFRVCVEAARADGSPVPATAPCALIMAAEAEPAASSLETEEGRPGRLQVSVTIETGGLPQAVSIALALMEDALRLNGGWDLPGLLVERAEPLDG